MGRGPTTFLKIAVWIIGLTTFVLSVFWLPWQAGNASEHAPEFAYLRHPVLIGLYVTTIPFYFALHQALKMLHLIDNNNPFSERSVTALLYIKYCAIVIGVLYVIGSILLITQNALHPGIAMIGFTITFASIVIATFAAVLQALLKNALEIKSENDLTV